MNPRELGVPIGDGVKANRTPLQKAIRANSKRLYLHVNKAEILADCHRVEFVIIEMPQHSLSAR
jgi:hypothetical protein